MKRQLIYFIIAASAASCADKNSLWSEWPEWEGADIVSINGVELIDVAYDQAVSAKISVQSGDIVSFSGIRNLDSALQPEWFTKESDGQYRFSGPSGEYNFVHDRSANLLYVDLREGSYPDYIWMTGEGWGHPGTSRVTAKGWSIDDAKDMLTCPQKAKGIFETVIYMGDGAKIKFFKFHAWENEINAGNMSIATPFLIGKNSTDDFVPGALMTPGKYRFIVDTNLGTVSAEPVEGEVEVPQLFVNDIQLGSNSEYSQMMSVKVYMKQGSTVTFKGFSDNVRRMLQPEWFGDFNDNTAVFKGPSASYYLCYDLDSHLIYIQNPKAAYPNNLLLLGTGFGHPALNYANSLTYTFDYPQNAILCRKVENDLFEATLFLSEKFAIKPFKSRNWNEGLSVSPIPENIIDADVFVNDEGFGHITGDIIPGRDFKAGVYTVRVDVKNNMMYLVGTVDNPLDYKQELRVNGTKLMESSIKGYVEGNFNLTQGQEMDFAGFKRVKLMLQPEYFSVSGDKVTFTAPSGEYRLSYSIAREHLYVERTGSYEWPNGLWITGYDYSHPAGTGSCDGDRAGKANGEWGWEDPKDYVCCVYKGNGIFETTLRLNDNFMFRFFTNKGSWTDVITPLVYDVSATEGLFRNDWVNFGQGAGFAAGTYRITVDTNKKAITAERITLE